MAQNNDHTIGFRKFDERVADGRSQRSTSWAKACGSSSVRNRHIACSSVEEKSDGQVKSLPDIRVVCAVASSRLTESRVPRFQAVKRAGRPVGSEEFVPQGGGEG